MPLDRKATAEAYIAEALRYTPRCLTTEETVSEGNHEDKPTASRRRRDGEPSFHWSDNEFEVLRHYDGILPPQIKLRQDILMRTKSSGSNGAALSKGGTAFSEAGRNGMLPSSYYNSWPKLTASLPFPGDKDYSVEESVVSTLMDFRRVYQTDESVELGLRISAHMTQDYNVLTILPCVGVWGCLNRDHKTPFHSVHVMEATFAQDIQRRFCPYSPVVIGLTPAMATMMVVKAHWYVLLVTGTDIIVKIALEAVEEVWEMVGTKGTGTGLDGFSEEKQELCNAYEKYMKQENVQKQLENEYVCVIDSLGIPLMENGWECVKECVFFCIFNAVLTSIICMPRTEGRGKLARASTQAKTTHACAASFHALTAVMWPRRLHVAGPRQPDSRSCGAFGLATVHKLCGERGFQEFKEEIACRKVLSPKRKRGNTEADTASYETFYNLQYVERVVKLFDEFIRSNVITVSSRERVTEVED